MKRWHSATSPPNIWRRAGTTNPIESAFGTTKLSTGKSKKCLSSQGVLHMTFELEMCAEKNWKKLSESDWIIAGARFRNRIEVKPANQAA